LVYVEDNFDDNVLDTAKWDEYEYLGGTVTEQEGRLTCTVSGFQVAGVSTKSKIDCKNADIAVKCFLKSGTSAGWSIMLYSGKVYTENLALARPHCRIGYYAGSGVQVIKVGKADTEQVLVRTVGIPFEAGLELRIFCAEGRVRFYYKRPSDPTWVEVVSLFLQEFDEENYVYVIAGSGGPDVSAVAQFDDFIATEAITPWGQVSSMVNQVINTVVPVLGLLMIITILTSTMKEIRE
jgi:hypothetical protein